MGVSPGNCVVVRIVNVEVRRRRFMGRRSFEYPPPSDRCVSCTMDKIGDVIDIGITAWSSTWFWVFCLACIAFGCVFFFWQAGRQLGFLRLQLGLD